MGLIIGVLVIFALIAAIWGRGTAKKLFSSTFGCVGTGIGILIVAAAFIFAPQLALFGVCIGLLPVVGLFVWHHLDEAKDDAERRLRANQQAVENLQRSKAVIDQALANGQTSIPYSALANGVMPPQAQAIPHPASAAPTGGVNVMCPACNRINDYGAISGGEYTLRCPCGHNWTARFGNTQAQTVQQQPVATPQSASPVGDTDIDSVLAFAAANGVVASPSPPSTNIGEKKIAACPQCGQKHSLPAAASGTVVCGKCRTVFAA